MSERPEAEKLTHAEVEFEHPSEHGDKECWRCEHYIPAKETGGAPRCEAVKGPIHWGDWCKRFDDVLD